MAQRRYWALAFATLTALMLSAAEPPGAGPSAAADTSAPATAPATTVSSAAAPTPVPTTATTPAATAAPAAATDAAHGDEPARFEATEKVRADFEVSFPVDI